MAKKQVIFLVDDDESMLECFQMILERRGYGVITSGDGQKAFEHAIAAPSEYDLLLTDKTMPGMSGSELARKLHECGHRQPVIMLTGWSGGPPEDSRHVDHLFVKPVDIGALTAKIKELLADGASPDRALLKAATTLPPVSPPLTERVR